MDTNPQDKSQDNDAPKKSQKSQMYTPDGTNELRLKDADGDALLAVFAGEKHRDLFWQIWKTLMPPSKEIQDVVIPPKQGDDEAIA